MDHSAYPFNGTLPRAGVKRPRPGASLLVRSDGLATSQADSAHDFLTKFPPPGNHDPLRALSLRREEQKQLKTWESTDDWFHSFASATLPNHTHAHPDAPESQSAQYPRVLTGPEVEADPSFGVHARGKKAQIRRHFRRLHGKRILEPERHVPEHPELMDSSLPGQKTEWVLVAKEDLAELQEIERMLREEKSLLNTQAAMTLDRTEISACTPIPMTKLAVENVCDREMKIARRHVEQISRDRRDAKAKRDARSVVGEHKHTTEIHQPSATAAAAPQSSMSGLFHVGSKQGPGYGTLDVSHLSHRKPIPVDIADLKRSKPSVRQLRFLELRLQAERRREKEESEEMFYEENIQRWAERYTEAYERKLDYQWYYVLANRYGSYTQEQFDAAGSRPGTLYLNTTSRGARGLQRLWRVWWPIRKARTYRAARLVQTAFRAHKGYKKWHPIIKLRMKYGRTSVLRKHWDGLAAAAKRSKRVKAMLQKNMVNWNRKVFEALKSFAETQKKDKEALAITCLKRLMNAQIYAIFVGWAHYTMRAKEVKAFMRRTLQNPHFAIWVEMTPIYKQEKRALKAVQVLQRHWRGYKGRKRARTAAWLLRRLKWIVRSKRARSEVWRMVKVRDQSLVDKEVKDREEGLLARLIDDDLKLKQKLASQTADVGERLEASVDAYLNSRKGKRELHKMAAGYMAEHDDVQGIEEAAKLARRQRVVTARKKAKALAIHDLYASHPPKFLCANPTCAATFVTREQYIEHARGGVCKGCESANRDFPTLHLLLLDKRYGLNRLRRFAERKQGVSTLLYLLKFWESLQALRKCSSEKEKFNTTLVELCDVYIDPLTATLPLGLSDEVVEQCLAETATLRAERATPQRLSHGMRCWRLMFGRSRVQPDVWGDDMRDPRPFAGAQWEALLLIRQFVDRLEFWQSELAGAYHSDVRRLREEERKQVEENVWKDRHNDALTRARHYRDEAVVRERAKAEKYDTLISAAIERVAGSEDMGEDIGTIAEGMLDFAIQVVTAEISRERDALEKNALETTISRITEANVSKAIEQVIEETIRDEWTDQCVDSVISAFAEDMLMSEVDSYVYVMAALNPGAAKPSHPPPSNNHTSTHTHEGAVVEADADSLSIEDSMYEEISEETATVRIQCMYRCWKARKTVRKRLVHIWRKRYDKSSGFYYYESTETGDTQWETPKLFPRLFPGVEW